MSTVAHLLVVLPSFSSPLAIFRLLRLRHRRVRVLVAAGVVHADVVVAEPVVRSALAAVVHPVGAVVVGAGQGLSDKGLAETQESVRRTIHPGKEGHNAIANGF